jgi:hypothetical protein
MGQLVALLLRMQMAVSLPMQMQLADFLKQQVASRVAET